MDSRVCASVTVIFPVDQDLFGGSTVFVNVHNFEGTVLYNRALSLTEFPDLEHIGLVVKAVIVSELRRFLSGP